MPKFRVPNRVEKKNNRVRHLTSNGFTVVGPRGLQRGLSKFDCLARPDCGLYIFHTFFVLTASSLGSAQPGRILGVAVNDWLL